MRDLKHSYGVDLVKYLCAIMVVFVHTTPFLPYSFDINWYSMTILGRFVVPFFFISTGFFCARNTLKYGDGYFKKYIKSMIKLYLIWSLIYLPLGIDYIGKEFDIPYILYPVALIVALVYIGTYFHLWYIPALIFALCLVHWFMKHFKKRYMLTISFACILLGALETYYGFLPESILLDLFDRYISIFFTTRNGIFFGFFYVAWGYFIAQENTWIEKIKRPGSWAIVCFFLMTVEAYIIHGSNNIDSNILLMAAPFTIFLFLYCLQVQVPWNLPFKKLREYSSLYYFTHAYFLILVPFFLSFFQLDYLYINHGLFRFFSVLCCTHITSKILYHTMEHRANKKKQKRLESR